MKSILFIFCAFVLMNFISSCTDSHKEDYQSKIDSSIRSLHQKLQEDLQYDVPSLSIYVVSPKGTYFSTVTGKNGTPVTEDTYFRFASNTKNFTSTAILKMMQDGWLNLDDFITANIPGTNIPYTPVTPEWNFPHKNEITIRQLLQHNAGVYDITNDTSQFGVNGITWEEYMLHTSPDHQFTTTQFVSLLTEHNLTYGAPDTVYHYSNTGYSILGEIIRRVYSHQKGTEKTYGDYMNDYIIGSQTKVPLNIKFAELSTDQQLPNPYVKGYILNDNGYEITDQKNASGKIAEGNGIGTMKELSRYIRSIMRGENVLSAESLELMKNNKGPATAEGNDYALGCVHKQGIGYGHDGATEGYLSLMLYDPETDITTIVLLPFWDLRNDMKDFGKCFNTITQAALDTKKALGY